MDIFSPPCCTVSAHPGSLVICIWVNYRLWGNFPVTTSVCVCVRERERKRECVEGGEHTCEEQMRKDLERIKILRKKLF